MQKKNPKSNRPIDLRSLDEKFLREKQKNLETMSSADIRKLIHELQVHQIQLEMENETLRRTQQELEESRNRYYDLYDFAPIGYFTLDYDSLILEANLTGAKLLGVERHQLTKKPFSRFISPESQDQFYFHRSQAFETRLLERCELRLLREDTSLFHANLETIAVQDDEGVFSQLLITVKDITEREQVENTLRFSEEKFRDLYDKAPNAYFSINVRNGAILNCNKAAQRMLGYSKNALLCMKVFDLYADTPHGLSEAKGVFKRLKSGESIRDVELQMKGHTGESIWVSLSVEPVRDPHGKVVESRSMVIDISERKRAELNLKEARDELEKRVDERTAELSKANTLLQQEISERKQIEEALRESEEKYRRVVESASQGIIVVQDGLLRFVNPRAIKVLGHSEDALISKPFMDFAEPNDRDLVTDGYQKILRGEETPSSYLFRFITEDWTVKWLETVGVLIVWDGRPAILAFLNDITERKLAEEALRESEKKYSRVVENSLTGIFVVQNGRIVFANNRFADIFGYSKEELIGEKSLKIVHPDDRTLLAEFRDERLSGKKAREEYDIRGVKKDGTTIWTRRRVTLTRYRGSRAILGNVVNISRAKQMEENLRKSEENLRTLSSQLLVAHEEERKRVALELHDGIGQSLSAIKYRVETAVREMEEEKALRGINSLAPIVPMVQGAVEEVRRIQMDLRPSILDDLGILATVSWLCREFESIYPAISIEKQVDIQENDVPDRLKIVIYRISQEALNNIAKHSQANLVHLSLESSGGMINLSIDDDGVGFDVGEALSKEASKRGLGLSGMRERTQFSEGTFRIKSRKGAGTAVQASWQVGE